MNAFFDSQYLRSAKHTLEVPFQLQLGGNGRFSELVCSAVLRVLPGKRLVCFGEWNHQQIVAKIFLDSRSALRHCAREERGVKAFKDAGIKTPELLFKGVLFPDNTPVLVFQRIMQAQNLNEAWEKVTNKNQRVSLFDRVVSVIADQHNAGIKQEDIHPGNFLLTGNDIYTIDGDAVDSHLIGKPLPQVKSLRNIGRFFAQFHPKYDALIPGAFKEYIEKRKWQQGDRLTTHLIKEIQTQRNYRKNEYVKKIYRECTAFVCRKNWHQFMVCDRNFYSEAVKNFQTDPDSVLESGKSLKDGNSSTVSLIELDGRHFVVKRYNIKSIWHGLKRCVRPSRAWNSWKNSHRLFFILGIPTPKPVILIEKRWGPFRSTAYFVTEYIEGADIYHLFHRSNKGDVSLEGITKLVGELLQGLADASISHGDFKATNFFLSEKKLFILDLDAMCEYHIRWLFRRAFKRDLKRFMRNWTDLPAMHKRFLDQINQLKL